MPQPRWRSLIWIKVSKANAEVRARHYKWPLLAWLPLLQPYLTKVNFADRQVIEQWDQR